MGSGPALVPTGAQSGLGTYCATLSRLGSRGPVLQVGEQGRDGGPHRQRSVPVPEEGAFEEVSRARVDGSGWRRPRQML